MMLTDFHDHHLTLPPRLISPLEDLGTVDQALDTSRLSIIQITNKWHLCRNISICANHTLPCQLLVDGSQACLHLLGFIFKL